MTLVMKYPTEIISGVPTIRNPIIESIENMGDVGDQVIAGTIGTLNLEGLSKEQLSLVLIELRSISEILKAIYEKI